MRDKQDRRWLPIVDLRGVLIHVRFRPLKALSELHDVTVSVHSILSKTDVWKRRGNIGIKCDGEKLEAKLIRDLAPGLSTSCTTSETNSKRKRDCYCTNVLPAESSE